MEQQLKDDDTGWWVISREGKVWLPRGKLPFGTAQQWQLSTKKAHQIGEWEGIQCGCWKSHAVRT